MAWQFVEIAATVKVKSGNDFYQRHFGVLLTPCYPCSYYGGEIIREQTGNGNWWNKTNETNCFFRTLEQARKNAQKEAEIVRQNSPA